MSRILRHRPDGPGLGFIDLGRLVPGRVASRDFWGNVGKAPRPAFKTRWRWLYPPGLVTATISA
jgi:hypothetical protein